jgi:hypothetical protein
MDLGVLATSKHILDWDESDVHQWFRHLGYPQYEAQIKGIPLLNFIQPKIPYPHQLIEYKAIRYASSIWKVSSH